MHQNVDTKMFMSDLPLKSSVERSFVLSGRYDKIAMGLVEDKRPKQSTSHLCIMDIDGATAKSFLLLDVKI